MHMACENEKMVWKVSLNILWHHIKFEKHVRSWFWNHKLDLVLSIRNLLENIDDKKFRLRFQLESFEYYEMWFYKLKIVKLNFSWLLTNGKCTRNSFFRAYILADKISFVFWLTLRVSKCGKIEIEKVKEFILSRGWFLLIYQF